MDRNQRINDSVNALQTALKGWQQKIWTALPAFVNSYNAAKMTVSAQPTVQAQLRSPDGTWSNVTLPLCLDCPVVFPRGGGYGMTFPVANGDEGLLVFSSRCIDAWWQSGGVQPQAEYRMHDLSDGFFIPGALSNGNVPSGISTTAARLWKEDGSMYVELAGATGIATIKAPTGIVLDAPITTIKGATVFEGIVSGHSGGGGVVNFGSATLTAANATLDGKVFSTHTHSGVQTGGGNSGPPT